jgi:hypothetical protein
LETPLADELLIALANRNDLSHIAEYIRKELTKDEAMIVHARLRRYLERVNEFVRAIPGPEELKNKRNIALTWG